MLEFSHVSAGYGHINILDDICVSFPKGAITTILGPNGCGKSTLVQCLNGVSDITKGNITLDGQDFLSIPLRERAKRLAFLPQVRTVIPAIPVRTLVEHGRFPYLGFTRRKTAADMKIINHAMELAHITEYADAYVDTLSGGIRQRVFYAMVLAQDCEIMVFDEPTTYLDLSGQREFYALADTLRQLGKTLILILHDLNHALRLSDHLVLMQKYKIISCGTPQKILNQHLLEDVFDVKQKTFSDAEGCYYFFD